MGGKPCFEGVGSRSQQLFLLLQGEVEPLETTGTKSHHPHRPQWSLIADSCAACKPGEPSSAALPHTPASALKCCGQEPWASLKTKASLAGEGGVDSNHKPQSQVITVGASPSRSCAAPGAGLSDALVRPLLLLSLIQTSLEGGASKILGLPFTARMK